jgi:metal-dependent HD superfamily phosphatase/phosphodiesterase
MRNTVLSVIESMHSWKEFRTSEGDAHHLPSIICDFLIADSEPIAEYYYWMLDNVIVVQGAACNSCGPVIETMIWAMENHLIHSAVEIRIHELFIQIAHGSPHAIEVKLGNTAVTVNCRHVLRTRLPAIQNVGDTKVIGLRKDLIGVLLEPDINH